MQDWGQDGVAWKQAADAQWQKYMSQQNLGSISQNRLTQCDPAASTFCGIEITQSSSESSELSWRFIAVGDSCVMHLTNRPAADNRQEFHFNSYPCQNASAFSCVTAAISNYDTNALPPEFVEHTPVDSVLRDGDVLLMATDALSEWMIKLHDGDHPVWKTIIDLAAHEQFQQLVDQARRESSPERCLKDDDVALIVIRIGDGCSDFIDASWKYEPGNLLDFKAPGDAPSSFSLFLSDAGIANEQENPVSGASSTQVKSPKKESCLSKFLIRLVKRLIYPQPTQIKPSPSPALEAEAAVPIETQQNGEPSQMESSGESTKPELVQQESGDVNK